MELVLRTGIGTDTLGPTLKWVQNVYSLECTMHMMCMFRGKTFQLSLTGHSYRIFIEGLKSPVTKAAYNYGFQKYMKYLNITNPDY
jgi:hypothetical protein